MRHRHLRRRHALHGHQQKPVRRQQQADLHADEIKDAEPDQVDLKPLQDRHEHRQRDQHHADLVDEQAEEDQQEQHAGEDRSGRKAAAEHGRDDPFGGAGEAQDLREGRGAEDDEQDHRGNADGAAQRRDQRA